MYGVRLETEAKPHKTKVQSEQVYEVLHGLIDPYTLVSNQFRLQLFTI